MIMSPFLLAAAALAPLPAVVAALDEAEDAVQEILDEYDDAMQAFSEAYAAADGDAAAQQRIHGAQFPDANDYAPRLMVAAETYPESSAAIDALVWVASRTSGEERPNAIEWLMSEHVDDERMADLALAVPDDAKGREILRTLIDTSPHASVKGAACYALALQLAPPYSPSAEWTTRDEYIALLERVKADFGDVVVRGQKLAQVTEGALFEVQRLQIGMDVPDIVAEDVDGVPFKLSDYRGKVVMLDFWGDW